MTHELPLGSTCDFKLQVFWWPFINVETNTLKKEKISKDMLLQKYTVKTWQKCKHWQLCNKIWPDKPQITRIKLIFNLIKCKLAYFVCVWVMYFHSIFDSSMTVFLLHTKLTNHLFQIYAWFNIWLRVKVCWKLHGAFDEKFAQNLLQCVVGGW